MNLSGTWRLHTWDCTIDGRSQGCPFGRKATGTLIYTDDGYMSAILMQPNRPSFDYPNLAAGSDEEKLAAVNGYVSYAGSYHVEDSQIIHHVELSLLPNWIGTDLIRDISWDPDHPDHLVLTTLPAQTRSGKTVVNRLQWEKREDELG